MIFRCNKCQKEFREPQPDIVKPRCPDCKSDDVEEVEKKVYAKDCKCCKCGKQAVAFWPVCDPDIPSNPYCRKCLDKVKERLTNEILSMGEM